MQAHKLQPSSEQNKALEGKHLLDMQTKHSLGVTLV